MERRRQTDLESREERVNRLGMPDLLKVFPNLKASESDILAVIANKGKPLSTYDFIKEQVRYREQTGCDLPAYSTIRARLASLEEREYVFVDRRTRGNRIVLKYGLSLIGLLASLTSPILTNQAVERVLKETARQLRLPERYFPGIKLILNLWFNGLSDDGRDLEASFLAGPTGLVFYQATFTQILSIARVMDPSLFHAIMHDDKAPKDWQAFRSYLSYFDKMGRSTLWAPPDDPDCRRAYVGSFQVTEDKSVRMILHIRIRNLQDALAEIVNTCRKSVSSPNDILKTLTKKVGLSFLSPSFLCGYQVQGELCMTTHERCVAASEPGLILKCPRFFPSRPPSCSTESMGILRKKRNRRTL